MRHSDIISQFIRDILNASGGIAEIGRNELALKFNVVPSQINYVLSSRFTPEQGYIVESRRGGGGYIKIKKISLDKSSFKMHIVNSIGGKLDCSTANIFLKNMQHDGLIDLTEYKLILNAIKDNNFFGLSPDTRDKIRATIFKNMLICTL